MIRGVTTTVLVLALASGAALASGSEDTAKKLAGCPLSQASLVDGTMVIDDVTDVPGCEGEDRNKLTVFSEDPGGGPRYFDSTAIAPTTAAGPGCVHDVLGSGVDGGVYCPGAVKIVVNGRGGDDRAGYFDYKQATGIPIVIHGGKGKDSLSTMPGRNELFGDAGNDLLNGSGRLNGGAGRDTLTGGKGRDILKGGSGNDLIQGGADRDYLNGGPGGDLLRAGPGNDFVFAEDGRRDRAINCGPGGDAASVDFGIDPKPRSC